MESSAHIKCEWGFIIEIEMCSVMNCCVLKILSFKDSLVYHNSFLHIPKSQPVDVSCMFLKSLFLEIKKMCMD